MNENKKVIEIPTWLMQVITTVLLGSILTGVIAINIRFGELEKRDVVQDTKIQFMQENYATKIWTTETFQKVNTNNIKP